MFVVMCMTTYIRAFIKPFALKLKLSHRFRHSAKPIVGSKEMPHVFGQAP
jgi:hypothetical protein